ncbi:uncharacterized protein EV154DRAFT_420916 [Mucor mucedo]|uniref:uncharacterized protein n=1 Tax=Mucor mucedo TaxID=29922 RepID=UPI0022206518|nr:uncharacterized protein EV154DRAFT_420916 [Mucor mucedo]KAI7891127.1 hypothetical protein EV154DRAFT_420916 [Mucor mucedo]
MITNHLPRQSISRLCLTCTQGYGLFLPTLYRHLELGHRTQIKQLAQGLIRNRFLKETVQQHTHILTLSCRQGGNSHDLIILLFNQLPNIKQLYFRDFLNLSVQRIVNVLHRLPNLTLLDFSYCDLKESEEEEEELVVLEGITTLNLVWTDFSTAAIRQLWMMTPNLTRVHLGANHNRQKLTNDTALIALTESCPRINDLEVSLQQVQEDSICKLIQTYGSQLERLSVRCEGNDTLRSIAHHTQSLQQLILRCNYSGYYNHHVMHIFQQCQSLTHLEMVSWPLQDVPTIVLDQLRYRHIETSTSSSISAPTSSYIEGIKRTVALDRLDLQEIRRLCPS